MSRMSVQKVLFRRTLDVAHRLSLMVRLSKENEYYIEKGVKWIGIELGPVDLIYWSDTTLNNARKSLVHEIGHYIVASGWQRGRKDYGIPPFKYMGGRNEIHWDTIEAKAQLVEKEIERRIGVPTREVGDVIGVEGVALEKAKTWWEEKGKTEIGALLTSVIRL